jgi:hypothetical protein
VAYSRAERVLKRLDGDADGKINFDDWINGLIPESQDPEKYDSTTEEPTGTPSEIG